MEALAWSDYICPWCYVGLDRTGLLRSLGVSVVSLPYELHPEIPVDGGVRNRGRSQWGAIAAECEEVGLPFSPPERVPNTRAVLEVAECVRRVWPEAFEELHGSLFRAHFAEGQWLGDEAVVDTLVAKAGVDPDDVRRVVAGGEPGEWVETAVHVAAEVGVAGTPAWLLARKLLVPGVMPRSFYERAVAKLPAA